MADNNENKVQEAIESALEHEAEAQTTDEEYSLNDDRRVKTLSPTALVLKRFFRNRVAVTGLVILAFMFIFSFIGGLLSPYSEDQLFYRYEEQDKQYAAIMDNSELRYIDNPDTDGLPTVARAKLTIAVKSGDETFESKDVTYRVTTEGEGLYAVSIDGEDEVLSLATYDTVSAAGSEALSFDLTHAILIAATNGETSFEYDGVTYDIDEAGTVTSGGEAVATASRYVINAVMSDVTLTAAFKEQLIEAVEGATGDEAEFTFTDDEGTTAEYKLSFDAEKNTWNVLQAASTKVYDTYSSPSKTHWLGTDKNGMDMLTRLMYGGRVSLYIGFIVVFMETIIGVIMGGISGYFGGWVDNLIMRIVDVFYCIPSLPIIIILGAAMDALRVDPQIRMIYLMLLLGFLGWAGIARLVRGQILSLREQEFMVAAEATGIRASRRIFRHLIPNVIPQLIVIMTMSLGNTIITEATLSFLGLGVKFPFASWGNIINDVNNTFVLTNYWFIWIPAGVCLLATVLAFNLVGDGLRDAFDPKMKR